MREHAEMRMTHSPGYNWSPNKTDKIALTTMDPAFVLDVRTARSVTSSILYSQVPVIGVSLFFDNSGFLCLAAIKHWDSRRVWLYDLKIYPQLMFDGELGRLFSTAEVRKVVHNSRAATKQIEKDYGVRFRNTFDTQLAFDLFREDQGMPKRAASLEELESFFVPHRDFSQLCPPNIFELTIPDFWRRRPLSKALQLYAGRMTFGLVPELYQHMIREMAPETVHLLDTFIDDNIHRVLSQSDRERRHQPQSQRRW